MNVGFYLFHLLSSLTVSNKVYYLLTSPDKDLVCQFWPIKIRTRSRFRRFRRLFAQSDGGERTQIVVWWLAAMQKEEHFTWRSSLQNIDHPPPYFGLGAPWFLTLKRWQTLHNLKACYIFLSWNIHIFAGNFLFYFESSCRGKNDCPKTKIPGMRCYLRAYPISGGCHTSADSLIPTKKDLFSIFQHRRDLRAGTFS